MNARKAAAALRMLADALDDADAPAPAVPPPTSKARRRPRITPPVEAATPEERELARKHLRIAGLG